MLEDLVPLEPLHFFDIELDVGKEETLLPDFLETGLAKVYMWWAHNGVHLRFEIARVFDQPHFPAGDCIELFFDTRDVKSATITRFCHHFFVLPEKVDGEQAGEVTRFRTEERHPLASPDALKVHSKKEKGKRIVGIFVPKEALYGYDPSQFGRLGFTYKVVGQDGKTQVLSASSEDFSVEQHPQLWASLILIKDA
ncbi:MAG: hypothetical protein H7A36_03150 [Chlamydiales bacterium]|nr:hypothetical protein [Chlamydiales bacterium]